MMRPRYSTTMRSATAISSSSSDEISSTADAALTGGADMAVDGGDRADVEPARWLRGKRKASLGNVISRASTAFCWLPPESAEKAPPAAAARTSKRCH